MRLRSLELTHFRCFDRRTIDLDRDVTVVFGDNGAGKSTLLDAIALALAVLPGLGEAPAPSDRDLAVCTIAVGPSRQREQEAKADLSLRLTLGDGDYNLGLAWERGHGPSRTGQHDALVKALRQRHGKQDPKPLPLLAVFPARRAWRDSRPPAEAPIGRFAGYEGAMSAGTDLAALRAWWRQKHELDLSGPPVVALRCAEQAITSFLGHGALRPHWSATLEDVVVNVPALKGDFALRELSDGYRNLIGMIADLARRAAQLNTVAEQPLLPDLLADLTGVVAIDEIDLHLHPRWQREVLEGLRRAFPKVQWILTTHSPQVLASVRSNDEVIALDDLLEGDPVYVRGRDSNGILSEPMDALAQPEAGERKLRALWAAIDADRTDEAERLLVELETEWWGPHDVRLVEARATLDLRG
jgi:hypothetical protein